MLLVLCYIISDAIMCNTKLQVHHHVGTWNKEICFSGPAAYIIPNKRHKQVVHLDSQTLYVMEYHTVLYII